MNIHEFSTRWEKEEGEFKKLKIMVPSAEKSENYLYVGFFSEILSFLPRIKDFTHSFDFYAMTWITHASGTYTVNGEHYELRDRSLMFVHPGSMCAAFPDKKAEGLVIAFSEEVLKKICGMDYYRFIYLLFGETPFLPIRDKTLQQKLDSIAKDIYRQFDHWEQSPIHEWHVLSLIGQFLSLVMLSAEYRACILCWNKRMPLTDDISSIGTL